MPATIWNNKNSITRYTLQGRGAKHSLRPRPLLIYELQNTWLESRARHMTCGWRSVNRTQFSLGYGLICQKTFFSSFEKKAPNRLQKRVRNGSPSVPLLSLKARFWRFYFSFFQTLENPCLKLPSVLSNVHPPIYQSQKSIISRTDAHRTPNISDLAV